MNNDRRLLEIAVFNIQSAVAAEKAGANRIELCENAAEGGTTPSLGTLKLARAKTTIPIFPMIRPRGGDFLYTNEEFTVMEHDVLLCKELGFEGVVFGLLNSDGTVDIQRTTKLVHLAYPMEVTFHRAFDRAVDPFLAMEEIIAAGCQRILTSGQVPNANDGKELIRQLIEKADDRIIIMPGSGVRSENIKALAEFTGAVELHSSARKNVSSAMQFIKPEMKENLQAVSVDVDEIKKMQDVLQ